MLRNDMLVCVSAETFPSVGSAVVSAIVFTLVAVGAVGADGILRTLEFFEAISYGDNVIGMCDSYEKI